MSVGTTYIVIEIPEKENGLDIVNYLMTQTKARFTITKNIGEYAEEKGKLAESSGEVKDDPPKAAESRASDAPPPPVPIREESPDIELIEPDIVHIPKQETLDHPPEPYRKPTAQYNPEQQIRLENYDQMFESYQQKLNRTVPMNQYPGQNDYEDWPAASMSTGPVRSGKPEKKGNSNDVARNNRRGRPRAANSRNRECYDQKCEVCDTYVKVIAFDMNARANHAIVHLDMKRYACPVDGCPYTSKHRSNAYAHLKSIHSSMTKVTIHESLTLEQKAQLKEMVCKCFPEMRGKIKETSRGTHVDYEVDEDGVEEAHDDF